jgi:SAM-dependent methyltransferase
MKKNGQTKNNFECRICGNTHQNTKYIVDEVQFGLNEQFDYYECSKCGCLQIKDIPKNIASYYPQKYSAYQKHKTIKPASKLSNFLKLKKSQFNLGLNHNSIGFVMHLCFGGGFVAKLKPAQVRYTDTILDVGTGTGGRLLDLYNRGFKNLLGTDIFIPETIHYSNGVKVLKKDIDELEATFDFIMLNHVFEHMPNPLEQLEKLYNLLKKGKYLLIRIPVADSFSWKNYRENWVALDAPRHFHLLTRESMEILAKKANFKIKEIIDDSSEYQFIGSEQIKKGIAVYAENSYFSNPEKSMFNKMQIKKFKSRAKKLNNQNLGDNTCFYLYKE